MRQSIPLTSLYELFASERCHRPLTAEQYLCSISILRQAIGHAPTVDDLTTETFRHLVSSGRQSGRRPATINKTRRHLLVLARFAVSEGMLRVIPRVRSLPEERRIPRAFTLAEISRLISAAGMEYKPICEIPASRWWRAHMLVAYDTGWRKRTILQVPLSCLELATQTITCPAEFVKSRCELVSAISEQTCSFLEKIVERGCYQRANWKAEAERVFPWPYDSDGGYRVHNKHFKRIMRRAGVSTAYGCFHRFRKSRATYGENIKPGSATIDLSHSSRAVTTEYYLDSRLLEVHREVVDKLPRPVVA